MNTTEVRKNPARVFLSAFTTALLVAGAVGWVTAAPAAAQTGAITGTITSAQTGEPLSGAQVSVESIGLGALTQANGRFLILRVPPGTYTVQAMLIGYATARTEVTVAEGGSAVADMSLEPQALALEGVVVTALGIHREQRSLAFASQSVTGEKLREVPTTNFMSSLQGNVAGVHVTNSASPFGSARIVVRGASSILGENQPLVVVDGIPVDNSAATLTGYGGGSMGGYNVGNAAGDIDPDNIESISVLKGPNAAALYGSAAANGAIVITTKKGRGPGEGTGFGLSATIGSQIETPLMLPAYQNQYGQGAYGEFNFVDGNGGGVYDYYDESWGPKLDGRTNGCVFQYDANGDPVTDANGHPVYDQGKACNQFFGAGPWVAHPNNVRDFFDMGVLTTLNVAVSRSAQQSNVRLSVGRTDENGMYPGNRNIRTDVMLAGGAQISDKLSTEASLDYINDGIRGQPKQSYDEADPMQNFIWFGRQVDMSLLKRQLFLDPTDPWAQQIIAGNSWLRTDAPMPYSWNYSYHDNPYWQASQRQQSFDRNRLLGHASATYAFNDWLNVTGRVGRDWFSNHLRANYPVNTVDGGSRLGAFDDYAETHDQTTMDFLVNAKRPLAGYVDMTINAGGSIWKTDSNRNTAGVSQLVIPGVYTLENSAGQPDTHIGKSKKQVNSLYASASFNYKNWFNVDLTGRNDWSSTLPKDNNSYFYPSVGAAFIFSDAFGIQSPTFSYGKLRASWTRVGNDTDPYALEAVYGAGTPWAGQPTFTAPNTLPNPILKPEQTTGVEFGTDLGFFDNRLILNATWYQKNTKDQILPVSISNATGYTSAYVNSGEVRNRGVELVLNATPIDGQDFRWNVAANWAKNDSKVISLYEGVDRIIIGSFWRVDVTADVGEPYGTLVGARWARDDQGRILVSDGGLPIRDPNRVILGNYNPDWVGGITNTLTYKSLSLSVLLDGQYGGNVYSVTKWFGNYAGVLKGSLAGREVDWDDPGYLVPNSVYKSSCTIAADGAASACSQVNTTHVNAQDYWENTFYAQETGLVDATYLKLRDARLSYRLPDDFTRRMGFSSAVFSLVGHNLFLWSKQDIIDPETAFDTQNRQGVENAQLPTARSIGFTLTIRP